MDSADTVAFNHINQAIGSPVYHTESYGPVELLPNPDFVFPSREERENAPGLSHWNASASTAPSHQFPSEQPDRVLPRQAASALPAFSFSPGSLPTSPSTTPISPTFPGVSTPSRARGHRRGGSEFVGGNQQGSISITSAGSHTHGAQTSLSLPPPRRTHGHRRSGAVSCQDLEAIKAEQAKSKALRTGSAPASPSEENKPPFPILPPTFQSLSSGSGNCRQEAEDGNVGRRIVGFSDRVEFIRPLSIISSETESSMSTIRAHQSTGSCSSVLSSTTTSPSSTRIARPSLSTVEDVDIPRPQTGIDLSAVERQRSLAALEGVSARPRTAIPFPVSRRKGGFFWDKSSKPAVAGIPSPEPRSDEFLSQPALSPALSEETETQKTRSGEQESSSDVS